MTVIYLDESGYTGDDLLNREQPFFVVASTIVPNDEALDLLRRSFPRYQGREFKFTNIWRRETHRASLRNLARELPAFYDRAFLWIIDKRFCVLTKMLDYLIEPLVYETGGDFYVGGYAQRFMNSAHRDILHHGSDTLYDETVASWDAFARAPSAATMEAMRDYLQSCAQELPAPLSSLYALALDGARSFLSAGERFEDFIDSSEIQLTSVFSSVIWWRQRRKEDFHVTHDQSSNFLRQRDVWTTLLRDDFGPEMIRQGDGSLVEFPLRVRSTTSVASETSPSVQLCDVLAGLYAKAALAFDGRQPDPFMQELLDLGAGELAYAGVIPRADYADAPPPRRAGPDMVDRMVELLTPELERIAAERAARE